MIATSAHKKAIDSFIDSLIAENELQPSAIARKFSQFCGLLPPLEYDAIVSACYSLGVDKIKQEELPNNLRGFHSIYDGRIEICIRPDEWVGGISHTLLHEMFEIIIELYTEKTKSDYALTEYKANLFAASVLMPEETFLEFCFRANFDLQLIREKYYQALFSLVLRLQHLFQKRNAYYVGIVAENQMAYGYREYPMVCNSFENFRIAETTLDQLDESFNAKVLYGYLQRAHAKIFENPENDFIGTVEIESKDFLVKASPIPNPKRIGVIKQIGIQVIFREDWEKIQSEVFKK